MTAMSSLPISNVGVLRPDRKDAELSGNASRSKMAALDHYQKKLNQARKYIDILLDPRLEEMSAQWIANYHGVGIWMVNDIRKLAGIRGHQKRSGTRRPNSTKQLERWQR